MFDHIFKHLEVRQNYSTARVVISTLFSVFAVAIGHLPGIYGDFVDLLVQFIRCAKICLLLNFTVPLKIVIVLGIKMISYYYFF